MNQIDMRLKNVSKKLIQNIAIYASESFQLLEND